MNTNNKGFTLIELLAMLIVLGVLMAVTVPNITGILNQSKTNIIKEDVSKMVDTAKTKISTHREITNPANGKCLIFTLKYLNDNENFGTGPNNGKYSNYDSFVIVKRTGTKYQYFVRLVEESEGEKYGVNLVDYDQFIKKEEDYIGDITNTTKANTATTASELATDTLIKTYCNSASTIQGFYREP